MTSSILPINCPVVSRSLVETMKGQTRVSGFTWMAASLTAASLSGSGPLCANTRRQLLCRLVIRSVLTGEVKCNAERGTEFVIARVPLSYRSI